MKPRVVAMIVVAVALAFSTSLVATAQNITPTDKQTNKVKGWRPAISSKAQTLPGPAGEPIGGPRLVAEEAYANRPYPAAEIPFFLTVGAQAAFDAVNGRGVGRGKNVAGQWTLIGPSSADFPAILTFSDHDYITSGRITALAIAPDCNSGNKCRLWVGAAGGGVWRTDNALSGGGSGWTFVSGTFATNAIGTLTYDTAHGSLYAGTGEPNASGDSEAGLGIYKSTDGGSTWTHLAGIATGVIGYSGGFADGRSISSIVIDPTNANVIYVGTARGVRGVSSVTGGSTSNPPPIAAPFGLWKSTDGGATFGCIFSCNPGTNPAGVSARGVNHVTLDPSNNAIVYAAAFQLGIWRSTDGGASFTQIFTPLNPAFNTDRAEFAVAALSNGKTRMYVGDGASAGALAARFYRTDDATAAAPVFTNLTTAA